MSAFMSRHHHRRSPGGHEMTRPLSRRGVLGAASSAALVAAVPFFPPTNASRGRRSASPTRGSCTGRATWIA